MSNYEKLFAPGKIGQLELKNRVVMTAMGTGYANADGTPSERIMKYYEERAKGGVGLIVAEVTRVNDDHGVATECQLTVTREEHIEPLRELVERVHQYGTKLFLQLHHPGRQTFSAAIGGQPVVAPSPIPCQVCRQETRELTTEEVEEIVQDFIRGAKIAQTAGVDGVELHGAHGYLINQFLSPYTNKRNDKYGGSFENRLNFLREMIVGIRKECGENYPLVVRLTVDEFLANAGIQEKGLELEDGIRIAKELERMGVDAIDVSCGIYETMNTAIEPTSFQQGWRTFLPEAIKKEVNIPVIAVSVIRDPQFAEELLEEGTVDFIGMGRSFLADPEWVVKVEEGREEDIRKCISCLHCFESIFAGNLECAVNGRLGREVQFDNLQENGEGKTVAIIGAGPAGMESARVLAMRGFKPVIFEKGHEVGGQLLLANKPPQKDKITWLIDYLKIQLEKLGVEVKLNCEATVERLQEYKPSAVIVATGADAFVPSIEGAGGEHVFTPAEILSGAVQLSGKKIAVIGSGMTGLETAELLAEQGNSVSVYEMLPAIGQGIYFQNLIDITSKLAKLGVPMLPSHKLEKIGAEQISLEKVENGEKVEVPVDAVILSLGVKPNIQIIEELEGHFEQVHVIGDANKPRKIAHAIKEGFEIAYNL